jgi:hypothetical protein
MKLGVLDIGLVRQQAKAATSHQHQCHGKTGNDARVTARAAFIPHTHKTPNAHTRLILGERNQNGAACKACAQIW